MFDIHLYKRRGNLQKKEKIESALIEILGGLERTDNFETRTHNGSNEYKIYFEYKTVCDGILKFHLSYFTNIRTLEIYPINFSNPIPEIILCTIKNRFPRSLYEYDDQKNHYFWKNITEEKIFKR